MSRETRRFVQRVFPPLAPTGTGQGHPRGGQGQGQAEDVDINIKPA